MFALSIVLPMTLVMTIGYLLKRLNFLSKEFIAGGKKLCFYIFLSVSLFKSIYDANFADMPIDFILFSIGSIALTFIISIIICELTIKDESKLGVMIQGMFRSNIAYIGIPLSTQMFTQVEQIAKASLYMSLVSMVAIPITNTFSVLSLSLFKKEHNENLLKEIVIKIITNPCIDGIAVGIVALLIRESGILPAYYLRDNLSFLYKTVSYLAQCATPFSLLMVGAQLDFGKSARDFKYVVSAVLMRILIFPAVTLFCAYKLGIEAGPSYACLIALSAAPTAVSTAIMASQMGGDDDLANEIVVYTTLLSPITLFMFIYVMKSIGCL